jgi:hypothetical protein
MIITVDVTQEDIDNGERVHCSKCPIALAVHRLFPDAAGVSVAHDIALFNDGLKPFQHFLITEEAREFIRRFDHKMEVEPFSFKAESVELEVYVLDKL